MIDGSDVLSSSVLSFLHDGSNIIRKIIGTIMAISERLVCNISRIELKDLVFSLLLLSI